jgi:hypothetical protein
MASYAEPPYTATMPSQDFPLYSEFMPTTESYMPAASWDASYNTTSYDSHSSINAYAQPSRQQEYQYSFDATAKTNYHHYSPVESPNSGSQTFDNNPPHLSTSSESGASVSSSTMGSPSLNPPQYAESTWPPIEANGLGIGQEVLEKTAFIQDSFATTGFDYESVVATDKLPGCVGESNQISSDKRVSALAFPFVPRPLPSSAPGERTRDEQKDSVSQSNMTSHNVFKSPTTPASALLPTPFSSPSVYRKDFFKQSMPSPVSYKPRRNSLLSNEVFPEDPASQPTPTSASPSTPQSAVQPNGHFLPSMTTCSFPSQSIIFFSFTSDPFFSP